MPSCSAAFLTPISSESSRASCLNELSYCIVSPILSLICYHENLVDLQALFKCYNSTLKFAPKKLWQTLKNFDDPLIPSCLSKAFYPLFCKILNISSLCLFAFSFVHSPSPSLVIFSIIFNFRL